MTVLSEDLIARCRALGARMNIAAMTFRMRPVTIDSAEVVMHADDPEARTAAFQARYAVTAAEARAALRTTFADELDLLCDQLAQAGVAPPLPPADWDVPEVSGIAVILASIEL